MKISDKVKSNLCELAEAEYIALWKDHPPRGYGRVPKLGRLTDEEYNDMWGGKPPTDKGENPNNER